MTNDLGDQYPTADDDDDVDEPLATLSDEQLGRRVRETPAFRLAVACHHLAESVEDIRADEAEAWDRLMSETNRGQTRVQSRESVEAVVGSFLDSLEAYAALAEDTERAAAEAAEALADDEGDV